MSQEKAINRPPSTCSALRDWSCVRMSQQMERLMANLEKQNSLSSTGGRGREAALFPNFWPRTTRPPLWLRGLLSLRVTDVGSHLETKTEISKNAQKGLSLTSPPSLSLHCPGQWPGRRAHPLQCGRLPRQHHAAYLCSAPAYLLAHLGPAPDVD